MQLYNLLDFSIINVHINTKNRKLKLSKIIKDIVLTKKDLNKF